MPPWGYLTDPAVVDAVPTWLPAAGAVALVVAQLVPWPPALQVVPAVLDTAFLGTAAVVLGRRLLR